MQNILDYITWRGDLRFPRDKFNEVDNLILSSLAYLDFDGIVPPPPAAWTIALSKVAERNTEQMAKFAALDHNPFFKQLPDLFDKAVESIRYRNVRLSNYVNIVDYEKAEQFSAVVFSLQRGLHFIAFRGTDDTIVGWKEDFQMSFMDAVPAQKQAAEYLNSVASCLKGRLFLGGHSKGGNLAVYAAAFAEKEIRDRIITIYNNDGPGFQTSVIESEGYRKIVNKVCTLLPKSSVVGMLLEHTGRYRVVASSDIGIMQHNAFSWEVEGPRFVYDTNIAKSSISFKNTVRDWLEQLAPEQRAEFVDAVFEILQSTGAKTIGELSKEKLSLSVAMIKTFSNMDGNSRRHLIKAITLFFKESQKSINKTIIKDIDSLLPKRKKETERAD